VKSIEEAEAIIVKHVEGFRAKGGVLVRGLFHDSTDTRPCRCALAACAAEERNITDANTYIGRADSYDWAASALGWDRNACIDFIGGFDGSAQGNGEHFNLGRKLRERLAPEDR
jgi:hypothetical protein